MYLSPYVFFPYRLDKCLLISLLRILFLRKVDPAAPAALQPNIHYSVRCPVTPQNMTPPAPRSTPSTLPPSTSPIQASPLHPPPLPSPSLPSRFPSRPQRKNMSAALASVDLLPAVTLPAIFVFTQVNETTNAPFPAAKLDVPDKITFNNSEYCSPPC